MGFKVGDRVKRIKYNYFDTMGLVKDTIGTVSAIQDDDDGKYIGLEEFPVEGDSTPYATVCFELVSEQTELERLVDEANRGAEAAERLYGCYPGKVEISFCNSQWNVMTDYRDLKYRVKPKIEFPKMKVAGYDVTVDGDNVRIGCQEFSLAKLIKILGRLCRKGYADAEGFESLRSGIRYINGEHVPWKEADALLEALEKYQKELKS